MELEGNYGIGTPAFHVNIRQSADIAMMELSDDGMLSITVDVIVRGTVE